MASDSGPNQAHLKANYVEVIKRIVPEFYDETEYRLFGEDEDLQYNVLAKILYVAKNASTLIDAPSNHTSSQEFVPFFVPFNKKANCSPRDFQRNVLTPLGYSFGSFTNVSEFSSFVVASALPKVVLNNVDTTFAQSYSATVDPDANTVDLVQRALLDELGWVYLLNTSGSVTSSDSTTPSSILADALTENLFFGEHINTSEGVKLLFKWLMTNIQGGQAPWAELANTVVPSPFSSPSSTFSDNYWASGGQLASSLETLIDVWVNEDDTNATYFRDIVNASLLGLNVQRMSNRGPMDKMLKALSYAFYDLRTTIRDIQYLLDIEECPEEFLQYLGRYLGWTFFGNDPDKWRQQLKQAIYLYKAKGTRQALSQAVNMLIPSSVYSPAPDASGLQEFWESYFPNIIYYVIKTETDYGKDSKAYLELARAWDQALQAEGYDIQFKNFDDENPDNNARFLVDYILQYLNSRHDFLRLGGVKFRDSSFIQAQVSANEVGSYFHRGKEIFMPPWEEQRFYQDTLLTEDIVKDLSSLFARPVGALGLNLATSDAQEVGEWLSSSIGLKETGAITTPGFGANQYFRFLTSGLNLPFNYQKVVSNADLEGMSVFDYWNSKSSEVHTKLLLDNVEFSANAFVNSANTKLGRQGIPAIVDIFRQFAPFHVLNKIFVGTEFYEDYSATDSSALVGIHTLQSDMDQLNSSYVYDAFNLFSGTGSFSSISPSVYNPRQGRWVPSATLHPTTDLLWGNATETSDSVSTSAIKPNVKSYRTAGRRRNLKYKFEGWANNREGLNQPTPVDFFTSAIIPWNGLNVSSFVPKGFNFSSQSYEDTSGTLSGVYSQYTPSTTEFLGYTASAHFPVRNILGFSTDTSSFAWIRDVFGSPILRALTDIFIRRGKEDTRWLDFTNDGFENFKFGQGISLLFNDYNNKFGRKFRNFVDKRTLTPLQRYAGGFNILSHVFGPGFMNNNFSIAGPIQTNLSANAGTGFPYPISSTYPSWSAVVATEAISENNVFVGTDGGQRDLQGGILKDGAYGTYRHPLDVFEAPSKPFFSNETLLSSVSFVAPRINSLAVLNSIENPSYNVDLNSLSGITLIQRTPGQTPRDAVRVRFPLDGNMNYCYNGKLQFPPIDAAVSSTTLSAFAGWKIIDQARASELLQEMPVATAANLSAGVYEYAGSAIRAVVLQCSGNANTTSSVVGNPNNPSISTVFNPQFATTPKNLRNLDPGSRYRVSFDASTTKISGGQGEQYVYALRNLTKDKCWTASSNSWETTPNTLSATPPNSLFSATDDSSDYRTFSDEFPVDSSFEKGDSYELWFTMCAGSETNRSEGKLRNFQVRMIEDSKIGEFFNGSKGNKFFPDREYQLGVTGKIASISRGINLPQTLHVRVVMEQKPYLGNGWQESFSRAWAYNWNTKTWEESRNMSDQDMWYALNFENNNEEQTHVFDFHTLNSRTPLKYYSKSRQGPLQGYFASAGPVHDENSVYYVEVSKPGGAAELAGLTLLDVNFLDKEYNVYAGDYSRKNFQDVFRFFDELNANKSSRNAFNSSSTYMTSGGSRSEYLEYWGGSHSATNGNFGFIDNAG